MFTRLYTFIPQQACSVFEPFQLPGEHATLAAILVVLGSSNHITILPLMPGPLFTAGWTEEMLSKLSCPRTDQSDLAGNRTGDPLIVCLTPNQLSYPVSNTWLYKHLCMTKSKHIDDPRSLQIKATFGCAVEVLWSPPCQENRVAIGRAVVYKAWAAHAFSEGIKCRHCRS